MKRSYFLSRRLHHRAPARSRTKTRTRARARSLALKRKGKRSHSTRKRRVKGGGIGETVNTMDGIPVNENALVTDAKGVTRSVKNREMWWNRAETSELLGNNDI